MRKFIVASILMLWLVPAGAATVFAQNNTLKFASLRLSVEAEKAGFVLGEPIILKIQLTNPTESEIPALRDLNPAYGTVQVYISRNGGDFKRYMGPGWGTKDPPRVDGKIKPGDSVSQGITLLFHNKIHGRDDLLDSSLPIDEIGSYQILVEMYDVDFRQKIAAPVIDVRVGFPTSYAGESVWQALRKDSTKGKDLAYFAQTGDGHLNESVVPEAEELVRLFPDNEQAKQLSFALGTYHLEQGNVDAAIVYLKEAAASNPMSSLRSVALMGLAKSHLQKGDAAEALRVSEAAVVEYGESEVRKEFDRLSSAARQKGNSVPAKLKPTP